MSCLLLHQRFVKKEQTEWINLLMENEQRLKESGGWIWEWGDEWVRELDYEVMLKKVNKQREEYKKYWKLIEREKMGEVVGESDFRWAIGNVTSRAFRGEMEVGSFVDRVRQVGLVGVLGVLGIVSGSLDGAQVVNGVLTVVVGLVGYDFLFPRVLKRIQGVELQRMALTPVVDLFNHSSSAVDASRSSTDKKGGAKERPLVDYDYFRSRFLVRSGREYEAGEEVFVSYGEQSNDTFIQYYGFVEKDNKADTYVFGPSVKQELGLDTRLEMKGHREKGFNRALLDKLQEIWKTEGDERWWRVLKDSCERELRKKKTSIEEDLQKLRSVKDKRMRLVIEFRIEKKKTLKALIEMYS